ncbi:hypothetical protein BH11MYX2_BH11MYX2_03110 [soil metagenome]
MTRPAAIAMCIGVCLAVGACGDSKSPDTGDDDANIDAGPDAANGCWPTIAPIPRGSVELGAGDDEFAPMPETLPIFYGAQSGCGIMVRVRMNGFPVGEPGFPPPPANSFTRVRASFVDRSEPLTIQIDCALRSPYEPNSVGSYDFPGSLTIAFNTCWGTDVLVGAKIKVEVEIMDSTGSYAIDSHVITAAEPLDPSVRNIPSYCGM